MTENIECQLSYSQISPGTRALPVVPMFDRPPSPTFDDDNTSRPFLTIRTPEESMYLLTLLLQPPSPHEPEFNFSNQDQRPVLATAAQNYGAIGKPTSPDSNFDMAHHQSRRERIYKQADPFHEYPDTVVYFKQRKEGRTLAESAVGRKKTLIEPILKVTTAKSPDPVIFKDPFGNLIEVIQAKPVICFE